MIQLRRITQVNDPDLSRLMDLYILSFPEEERRDEKQLFRMIETVPEMSFNAVEENEELCDCPYSGIWVSFITWSIWLSFRK